MRNLYEVRGFLSKRSKKPVVVEDKIETLPTALRVARESLFGYALVQTWQTHRNGKKLRCAVMVASRQGRI